MSFFFTYGAIKNISLRMDRSQNSLNDTFKDKISDLRGNLNIKSPKPKYTSKFIEKLDYETCEIYKILNKLSDNNYDRLSQEMVEIIDRINDDIIQNRLCEKIMNIASKNSFYSKLYAKLINDLSKKYSNFITIFELSFETHCLNFKNIVYVSSNEDYDKYCDYIRQIDELEAFMMFFINLVNIGMFSMNRMMNFVIDLQDILIENINDSNKIVENESYAHNIFIAVRDIGRKLKTQNEWNMFLSNLKLLHDAKGAGKNNKIRFKIMDINDLLIKLK